jgi:hypothetical protein
MFSFRYGFRRLEKESKYWEVWRGVLWENVIPSARVSGTEPWNHFLKNASLSTLFLDYPTTDFPHYGVFNLQSDSKCLLKVHGLHVSSD